MVFDKTLRAMLALVLAVSFAAPAIPASASLPRATDALSLGSVVGSTSPPSALPTDSGLVIVKARTGKSVAALADGRKARGGIYVLKAPHGQTGAQYAASLSRNNAASS